MPVSTYSSGMRARLAFAISMAISFDWYLVDEITEVGDDRFKEKCRAAFKEKLVDAPHPHGLP
jgi:capsular polysaccharide transport system ATP-binding protein